MLRPSLRFFPPHSLHARRARQNVGYTALHWSAINDHPDVVRRLLASGANRTARDKGGKSALDIAREKRHAAVVALLEAPAVWDAARDGNNDELRKLIADGGDVNWKNPYVRSPLPAAPAPRRHQGHAPSPPPRPLALLLRPLRYPNVAMQPLGC